MLDFWWMNDILMCTHQSPMKKEKVENYYKNTCCDSCHHNSTSLVGTQER